MKRKKIAALFTTITLAVSLTACGGNNGKESAGDSGGAAGSGTETDGLQIGRAHV